MLPWTCRSEYAHCNHCARGLSAIYAMQRALAYHDVNHLGARTWRRPHLVPCQQYGLRQTNSWPVQVQGPHQQHGRSVRVAAKAKGPVIRHVCSKCGVQHARWYGTCKDCGGIGTIEEQETYNTSSTAGGSTLQRAAAEARELLVRNQAFAQHQGSTYGSSIDGMGDSAAASWGVGGAPTPARSTAVRTSSARSNSWLSSNNGNAGGSKANGPVSLRDMATRTSDGFSAQRMVLLGRTGQEINRVLGGGVVSGSLVLVGGEPGVGKSTLSLQIAAMIAQPDLDFDMLTETDNDEAAPSPDGSPAGSPEADEAESSPDHLASNGNGTDEASLGLQSSVARRSARVTASPKARLKIESKRRSRNGTVSEGSRLSLSPGPESGSDTEGQAAVQPRKVLYVSGEETVEQVADRGRRMGLQDCDTLHLLAECCLEEVLKHIIAMSPAAVVVDSVQTMYLRQLDNVSGSVVQLKECCSALLRLAKDYGITVFAIGHVTKNSDIAGPKALEHMVDAVLRMEGDMSQSYRLLRAGKNRFGTTDEVGVFCMDVGGLHAVADPSSMFLAHRSSGSSSVAVVMDGTRVLVLEVQALVTGQHPNAKSPPVRQTTGASKDRVAGIIVNVLHKFVMRMSMQNVIVNVTGGVQMREPAADLAVAVAIASSFFNVPVPKDIAAIGEIDLGGGLRPVPCLDLRLAELSKLKIRSAVIPNNKDINKLRRDPRFRGVELIPCTTLLEALQHVLGPVVGSKGAAGGGSKGQNQMRRGQASRDDDGGDTGQDDGQEGGEDW